MRFVLWSAGRNQKERYGQHGWRLLACRCTVQTFDEPFHQLFRKNPVAKILAIFRHYIERQNTDESQGFQVFLATGGSYTDSQIVPVPGGLLPGPRYLIVRTDVFGEQIELDRKSVV